MGQLWKGIILITFDTIHNLFAINPTSQVVVRIIRKDCIQSFTYHAVSRNIRRRVGTTLAFPRRVVSESQVKHSGFANTARQTSEDTNTDMFLLMIYKPPLSKLSKKREIS